MNEEQYAKVLAELARNDQEHESYNRRLKEHDIALQKQGDILVILERQNGNIERLTGSMNRMEASMENMDKRLETIEKEPGAKWKNASWEVFKWALIGLLTLLVGLVWQMIQSGTH